jgi:hypothetical protein
MTIKSDCWKIDYEALVTAEVVFEEPVTEKEAIKRFKAYRFEDIIDSEELAIIDIKEAEPIGGLEDD